MADDTDYDAIARGLLRPDRGALDALRARLVEVTDAREAWEIAAPVEWVGDARRRFSHRGILEAPPSVSTVLAACVDPVGMSRAEAFAREVGSRLVPLGGESDDIVVWSFWQRDLWDRGIVPPLPRGPALARAEAMLTATAVQPSARAREMAARIAARAPVSSVAHLAFLSAWWDDARDALGGRANPFEPLLGVLGTGYWVHRLEQGERGALDGAIALVMPTV